MRLSVAARIYQAQVYDRKLLRHNGHRTSPAFRENAELDTAGRATAIKHREQAAFGAYKADWASHDVEIRRRGEMTCRVAGMQPMMHYSRPVVGKQ